MIIVVDVGCALCLLLYFLLLIMATVWGYYYRKEKEKELKKELDDLRFFKHHFPDEWDKYVRFMSYKKEKRK